MSDDDLRFSVEVINQIIDSLDERIFVETSSDVLKRLDYCREQLRKYVVYISPIIYKKGN